MAKNAQRVVDRVEIVRIQGVKISDGIFAVTIEDIAGTPVAVDRGLNFVVCIRFQLDLVLVLYRSMIVEDCIRIREHIVGIPFQLNLVPVVSRLMIVEDYIRIREHIVGIPFQLYLALVLHRSMMIVEEDWIRI